MKNLVVLLLASLVPLSAWAQSDADADAEDDIWAILDELPARNAWDLAMHASYGNIGYWDDKMAGWIGLGVTGGYGAIVGGNTRVGGAMEASIEGEVAIYQTVALEPQFTLDRVAKGVQLGVSVGPSFLFHTSGATVRVERAFTMAPMVAGRFGYSKPYSRLGKRFFVLLEPKFRLMTGGRIEGVAPDYGLAIVVGAGRGH